MVLKVQEKTKGKEEVAIGSGTWRGQDLGLAKKKSGVAAWKWPRVRTGCHQRK